MNDVFVLVYWEDGGAMNEVMAVCFNEVAAYNKAMELLAENELATRVTVEHWHRDNAENSDADWYRSKDYWKEDA